MVKKTIIQPMDKGNWFVVIFKEDGFVISRRKSDFVILVKTGIQSFQAVLDPGFRRGDGLGDF